MMLLLITLISFNENDVVSELMGMITVMIIIPSFEEASMDHRLLLTVRGKLLLDFPLKNS